MTIQDLKCILLLSITFIFCKNAENEDRLKNDCIIIEAVDSLSMVKMRHDDVVQYFNINIFNNNSFPIEIFTIDIDTSINFIDNYFYCPEIRNLGSQDAKVLEIGAIRNDMYNVVKIDSFSYCTSKILLFYPERLFTANKFLYVATIQYQKKCKINSYESLINNFVDKDSLDCEHFYHKKLYFFLKKDSTQYNIEYVNASSDSIFREKINMYLK